MLDKQVKIMKVRAALERSREERSSLIKKRLHPFAMARWFKEGLLRISILIKNSPRMIYERIKTRFKRTKE